MGADQGNPFDEFDALQLGKTRRLDQMRALRIPGQACKRATAPGQVSQLPRDLSKALAD